jgi:predicted RNA-binding Zn ribbon-like protein
VPRYDLPRAAEGPLRLVQLFVNTVDHEHGREWWPTPAALGTWFAENGYPRCRPNAADLERARELRGALQALLRVNNVGGDTRAATAVVNDTARRCGVALELRDRAGLELGVGAAGADAAMGRIVAAAFEAMLDGSWSRLKACRNCGWVFYDTSKNRSGSWCSMQLCGNRTKTRAYRRRKAGTQT